jgi:hypothetical protein
MQMRSDMLWSSRCCLHDVELPKSNAKSIDRRITRSACKSQQLFLGSFGGSSKLGEFLPTIPMFITFMAPVSNRHGPIFSFLVD